MTERILDLLDNLAESLLAIGVRNFVLELATACDSPHYRMGLRYPAPSVTAPGLVETRLDRYISKTEAKQSKVDALALEIDRFCQVAESQRREIK